MKNTTLTDEQKAHRVGRFTASNIYKLMGAKGIGKTGETYIFEVASEKLTGQSVKPEFTAASTQWGIDHELEAMLYFEAATGIKIVKGETITNNLISGTPDGSDEKKTFGFEIKCPFNSGNHIKNLSMATQLDLLRLRPEYYWQCVAYMWLTGLNSWKFCSYDPRMQNNKYKMLILNLQAIPEDFKLVNERVTEANLMLNNIISRLS